MRSIARSLLVLFALYVSLAGCGSPQSPLVGTWQVQGPGPDGNPASTTVTFKPDGTMQQTVKVSGRTLQMKARYVATDGKMQETVESMTIDGKAVKPQGSPKSELGYLVDGDNLTLGKTSSDNVTFKRVAD